MLNKGPLGRKGMRWRDQVREDTQKREGKEQVQTQGKCLWVDAEECRRLGHKKKHPNENVNGNDSGSNYV